MNSDKRILYLDCLRVLAIAAVIMLHVSAQNWYSADVMSTAWQVFNAYDGLFRWGVPVFVMISGALFLGRDRSIEQLFRKNICRILIVLAFWSSLYAAWDYYYGGASASIKEVFISALKGHYHFWYLYMILGQYLIVPFLNKIVEDKKLERYFLLLAFLFAFFLPQSLSVIELKYSDIAEVLRSFLSKTKLQFVLGYTGFFVLGHFLNHVEISKKNERIVYVLGLLSALFTVCGTAWLSKHCHAQTELLFEYLTVNIMLMSIAVFVFAKQHLSFERAESNNQRLIFLSKCTFGMYLIHPFLIEAAEKWLGLSTNSFAPVLSVPLLSVIVFAVSFAISALLNTIPSVRKWLV